MTDIRGEGYGASHDWRHDITDRFNGGERGSRYICHVCGHVFVHLYDVVPDVFEAMNLDGVPDQCPGPP